MIDDFAATKDVSDCHSALMQCATHQQAAVAVERIVLGAHHCKPVFLRALDDATESLRELFRPCHFLIVCDAIVEETLVLRPPTKFFTQEYVGDIVVAKFVTKRVSIEVWEVPRVGDRKS